MAGIEETVKGILKNIQIPEIRPMPILHLKSDTQRQMESDWERHHELINSLNETHLVAFASMLLSLAVLALMLLQFSGLRI